MGLGPPRRLEGRVALVTGGSSGIGLAAALAFAREGASVVIASRGRERGEAAAAEVRALGVDAVHVAADVSDPGQVEALVARCVERHGRLDCAFNNAAAGGSGALCADIPEAEFDRTIAVNLKGVWLCMRHEIAQMLAQGAGAIVNMSSRWRFALRFTGEWDSPVCPLWLSEHATLCGVAKTDPNGTAELPLPATPVLFQTLRVGPAPPGRLSCAPTPPRRCAGGGGRWGNPGSPAIGWTG